MSLSSIPRRQYTVGVTALTPLDRLSEVLGGPRVFVKRDDQLGLAGGGNKTRKLEFLMADALDLGATDIITTGAVQSNHCRLTAAAASIEGLRCHLVIEERVAGSYRPDGSGNHFLFDLLGAASVRVVPAGTDIAAAMADLAAELEGDGHTPYVIPGGGSNATGALGYAACADEILAQSFQLGIEFDEVICASGSGGTHSGLLAGFLPRNGPSVLGMSVRFDTETQVGRLAPLVDATLTRLGMANVVVSRDRIVVNDAYVGDGYSIPTDGMVEAVRLLARTESILLDPVYTGKAMAGLIDLVRQRRWRANAAVLFVHTGGAPALYAYTDVLREAVSDR